MSVNIYLSPPDGTHNETLTQALERINRMKTKLTKWEREAIARYRLGVEAGEIEYATNKRLTRGRAVMLGGRLLVKEYIKQLEEERIARMKIHVFKIDISKFRYTQYLRKFHAILNETDEITRDASIITVEAQDDKQAIEAAQKHVRYLVRNWRNPAAIEDATWCLIAFGTVDSAHCVMAAEGYGYYYRADVTLNVDFNMHSPIRCVPVTGDTAEYED